MRVNGLKLCQRMFRLGFGKKKNFTKIVFKPWHRGPWAVVESPSLGVFKRDLHDTMGYGLGVNTVVLSLWMGSGILEVFFQPSQLYVTLILLK